MSHNNKKIIAAILRAIGGVLIGSSFIFIAALATNTANNKLGIFFHVAVVHAQDDGGGGDGGDGGSDGGGGTPPPPPPPPTCPMGSVGPYPDCVFPTLSPPTVDSLTVSGATVHASITSTGDADATESGFAYGTSPTLSATIATSTLGMQTGTASFAETITDLSANTLYYVRAYATNLNGTGYSSISSFTTKSFLGAGGTISGPLSVGYQITPAQATASIQMDAQPTATTTSFTYHFTRNLQLLDRGEDVHQLQMFLNSHHAQVAQSGPGSPGQETDYFGPLTYKALVEFQTQNADTILKPFGLSRGTGFFGTTTRAYSIGVR